jgi:hypothetical protein
MTKACEILDLLIWRTIFLKYESTGSGVGIKNGGGKGWRGVAFYIFCFI